MTDTRCTVSYSIPDKTNSVTLPVTFETHQVEDGSVMLTMIYYKGHEQHTANWNFKYEDFCKFVDARIRYEEYHHSLAAQPMLGDFLLQALQGPFGGT